MSVGIYFAIFRVQIKHNLKYGNDFISRMFLMALFIWVLGLLWTTALPMDATLKGTLTQHETLWYLVFTEAFFLSRGNTALLMTDSIREGSIATQLCKPYNYILYLASRSLADTLPFYAANVAVGGCIVAWAFGARFAPQWLVAAGIITLFLGWVIDFVISALIGCLAFVMEDTSPVTWIYSKLLLILGGAMIPLDFFPERLAKFAAQTPFALTLFSPARLMVRPDAQLFLNLVAMQALWCVVLSLILAMGFRRMSSQLSINGG